VLAEGGERRQLVARLQLAGADLLADISGDLQVRGFRHWWCSQLGGRVVLPWVPSRRERQIGRPRDLKRRQGGVVTRPNDAAGSTADPARDPDDHQRQDNSRRRVSYDEYVLAVALTLARRHRSVWSWQHWRRI